MNDKAYTLIELLGVITVIGIVSVIALPKIFNNGFSTKYYEAQESMAIISSKEYFNDYHNLLPKKINESVQVSLSTLVNSGYVKELKDTKKEKCNYEESYILVKKEKGKYTYDIRLKCNNYDTFASRNK